MTRPVLHNWLARIALLTLLIGISGTGIRIVQNVSAQSGLSSQTSVSTNAISSSESYAQTVYLPILANNYPWISPFGVETRRSLAAGSIYLTRTDELKAGWVRMGPSQHRISWSRLQPNENDPIAWGLLTTFENELRSLKSAGITPVIMVFDFPEWAVGIGQPPCAPIQTGKFAAFAEFMGELVNRYQIPEFNVHHWELGNEPDVDPDLLAFHNIFGCWGDIDDPYYGGRHYGEMLKVVTPVIKQKDPRAKVWIGGLLLDNPASEPGSGKPEWFLKGILEAGAAPYFDVVPYHSYIGYKDTFTGDYERDKNPKWKDWGGIIVGKARYLRQLMSQYGVQKPLFVNEASLFCTEDYCEAGLNDQQLEPYYQAQADFNLRSFIRGLSENLMGFAWYTLEGNEWRNSGLLKSDQTPRHAYTAYQQLARQLDQAKYIAPVNYDPGIEAYAFKRGPERVHVLWTATTDSSTPIPVPPGFIEAYTRDGTPLTPLNGMLPVGYSPIYMILSP